MTGIETGFRPESTETDRNARPEPTGSPYRGGPAVGKKPVGRNRARLGRAGQADGLDKPVHIAAGIKSVIAGACVRANDSGAARAKNNGAPRHE